MLINLSFLNTAVYNFSHGPTQQSQIYKISLVEKRMMLNILLNLTACTVNADM